MESAKKEKVERHPDQVDPTWQLEAERPYLARVDRLRYMTQAEIAYDTACFSDQYRNL